MHINKRILLLSVSSLLLLSPLLTSADTIAKGAHGTAVVTIQQQLVSAGFLAADNVTGYFGNLTRAAVIALQSAYNLETVGFVGHLTRAALTAAAGGSTKPHGKPAADTTPPSTPTNLKATAVSSSQISLSWTASTDNKGVTGYKVFRGTVQVGTATSNSYADSGLLASTAYTYTVSAYDAAGNNSAQSASASATTMSASATNTIYGGIIVAPYPTSATSTIMVPAITDLKKYLQQMDGVPYVALGGSPPPPGPSGYTFCANDGETCSFSGTVSVAYGANGTFVYKTFTGGTLCSYTIFGDPLPGWQKYCFIPGTPPPPGIPASSIALILSTSPYAPSDSVTLLQGKGPEAFVIRGDATSLKIIANNEQGLSAGIYTYLEQLGVRWLTQGPNWTIVPHKSDVTLTINKLFAPSYFIGHQMGPTGASWQGWDLNLHNTDDLQFREWARHMRTSALGLGGDVVDGYVLENWQYLQYHPDYFAKIDGVYDPMFVPATGGNFAYNSSTNSYYQVSAGTGSYNMHVPKLNAGNPAGVNYFCTWVVNGYKATRSRPGGDAYKWASVEPADGFGYANNYSELIAAGVGNGSPSDQTFYIADQCAKMIKTAYSDASVILLAYAGHSDPPSFVLEPNVIVQMSPYKFQGFGTPEDFITAWQAKASTLAIYDYWLIPVWSPDSPHMDYLDLTTKLKYLYNRNIRGLYDETTEGGGPMGIAHYVAEHEMWDLTLDDKALIDEWYTLAFGPAKAPMKDLMERWSINYLPSDIEFANAYQDLNKAEQLAAGGDPAAQARVDDMVRYVRYLQLWYEASNATAGTTLRAQLADALAAHIWNIEDSGMVYAHYMFDWAVGLDPSVKTMFDLSNPSSPGPGWASVHDLSHTEIMAIVSNGIASYPAPDVVDKNYTGPLVPLNPVWTAPPTTSPWGEPVTIRDNPAQGQDPTYIEVQIPTGLNHLPLQVVACEPPVTLALSDSSMNDVYKVTVTPVATTSTTIWNRCGGYNDVDYWQNVDIPVVSGHYTLRVIGGFRLRTWKGLPLTWRTALMGVYDYNNTPRERYYFYVPTGFTKIALWRNIDAASTDPVYTCSDTWRPIFDDPSGNAVTADCRDKGKIYVLTVPAGQDGKIWSYWNWDQYLLVINGPQAFSMDPQGLMVESDAKP